ncbi:MAG: hypothetical protein ACI4AH_05285 [Muribaculaceae bacterium]
MEIKYSTTHCNIKGCHNGIFKYHMCQEHYKQYVCNSIVSTICEEYDNFENDKASLRLKLKRISHFLIHYSFNIPKYFVEHFPLEHVFLGNLEWIKKQKSVDNKFVNTLIADFDYKENENLPVLIRIINPKKIDEIKIVEFENYLLDKNNLPQKTLFILCLIGVILSYLACRLATNYNEMFFLNIPFADIIQIGRRLICYTPLILLMIYAGLKLPSLYMPLIKRAYDLKLFANPEDNMLLLNEANFVKKRKDRLGSYHASLGYQIGFCVLFFFLFCLLSSINYFTIFLFVGCICIFASFNLIYPLIVPYFPIYNCIKHKLPLIILQHGDMTGGMQDYLKLQFYTFLFNELYIILLLVVLKSFCFAWWAYFLLFILLLCRANHAGIALIMSFRIIIEFHKQKSKAIRNLQKSYDPDTIVKLVELKKIKLFRLPEYIKFFTSAIIVPFIISVAANNINYIKEICLSIIHCLLGCFNYLSF